MKKLIVLIGLVILFTGLKAQIINPEDRLSHIPSITPWFKTYEAVDSTIVFPAESFLAFSAVPLATNTDTVKIQGSTASVGEQTAGYYYMIGSTGSSFTVEYYGIPLGQITIITKTGAGCSVMAFLKP